MLLIVRYFFFLALTVTAACQAPTNTSKTADQAKLQPALADPPDGPAFDLFVMPRSAYAPIVRIELKSLVRDSADPETLGRAATQRTQLQEKGITATGYFKYYLEPGGGARVKLNRYRDKNSRDADWEHRYPPDVRNEGQALAAPVDGFHIPNAAYVQKIGDTLFEITSFGGLSDENLVAFAKAYGQHLEELLTP